MNNKFDSKTQNARNSADNCKHSTNKSGSNRSVNQSGSHAANRNNTHMKNAQDKSGENCR